MARFAALDAFRGFTIAAMVLVNTPGSWSHQYAPLQHAHWHGYTPTDFIFPFFIFIVGSALFFSLSSQQGKSSLQISTRIIKRGATIFLIGLFLNAFPFLDAWTDIRIMGVLQRIGLVYIFAALMVLFCPRWLTGVISALLLIVYWIILESVGDLTLSNNPVRLLDIALLGKSHMWSVGGIAFDPEGLLSTLPAIVSALAGYEVTRYLSQQHNNISSIKNIGLAGLLMLAVALLWNLWLPINKSLWTPSYVVFSSGIAMLVLALFIGLVDVKKITWLKKTFEIYGLNPLFIYVLSALWVICNQKLVYFTDSAGNAISGYAALFNLFQLYFSPVNASLLFALAHVLMFWLISRWLYQRNIVVKI